MKYNKLGNSDLKVSQICLGTMTWGEQNSESEAHAQLNFAVDQGVNFIDTAEMYPVPPNEDTYAKTEKYIGSWIKANKKREKIILATKVVGKAGWLPHIRGGTAKLDRKNIQKACEDSLKRLNTDYIDLYQMHWPNRSTNYFGQLGYSAENNDDGNILETLETCDDLIRQGKVRNIGISNETAWGALKYLALAKEHSLPRPISIQNPYSFLNRSFEVGLGEVSHREHLSLLAYSPLGFGVLSGKYLNDAKPEGARLTRWGERFKRYSNPQAIAATQLYCNLAQENNLSPTQLALAFVNDRPFVTSNIIGATSLDQLKENIESSEIEISDQIEKAIQEIFIQFPNPSP